MTYALLTRMPVLDKSNPRLACVRHAASVRPEPGSNSPLYITNLLILLISSSAVHLVAYDILCMLSLAQELTSYYVLLYLH